VVPPGPATGIERPPTGASRGRFFTEAVGFLSGALPIEPVSVDLDEIFAVSSVYDADFADVRGQESAIRVHLRSSLLQLSGPGLLRVWAMGCRVVA